MRARQTEHTTDMIRVWKIVFEFQIGLVCRASEKALRPVTQIRNAPPPGGRGLCSPELPAGSSQAETLHMLRMAQLSIEEQHEQGRDPALPPPSQDNLYSE